MTLCEETQHTPTLQSPQLLRHMDRAFHVCINVRPLPDCIGMMSLPNGKTVVYSSQQNSIGSLISESVTGVHLIVSREKSGGEGVQAIDTL